MRTASQALENLNKEAYPEEGLRSLYESAYLYLLANSRPNLLEVTKELRLQGRGDFYFILRKKKIEEKLWYPIKVVNRIENTTLFDDVTHLIIPSESAVDELRRRYLARG